jgi:hypothetical protein
MIFEATYMLNFSLYAFSMQILGLTFEVFSSPSNSAQDAEELDASKDRDTRIYVETVLILNLFWFLSGSGPIFHVESENDIHFELKSSSQVIQRFKRGTFAQQNPQENLMSGRA